MPCGSSLLVVHQDQIVYQTKNNLFNPKPQYIRTVAHNNFGDFWTE